MTVTNRTYSCRYCGKHAKSDDGPPSRDGCKQSPSGKHRWKMISGTVGSKKVTFR